MTNLTAKLCEPSLDELFTTFAREMLEIFNRSKTHYFVFGSTALLARLPRVNRVPGDIDFGIGPNGLERMQPLLCAAGFQIKQRPGFTEITSKKSRCHIVEGHFNLIDPHDESIISRYDFTETLQSTDMATFRLTFSQYELRFLAPSFFETLFLCLLKPINTTTLQDFLNLLDCDLPGMNGFTHIGHRSSEATEIVRERLQVLSPHCNGRRRTNLDSLVAAIKAD